MFSVWLRIEGNIDYFLCFRKAMHRLRDQITRDQEQKKYIRGVKVTRVKKQKSIYNSNSQCLVS